MEAAQPWITNSTDAQARAMISDVNKAKILKEKKAHFKIISDLMNTGTADISNDGKWVAYANRFQLALEDYMGFFPEDVKDALESAERFRQEINHDGINRRSLARYHFLGCLPRCISELFSEMYPDKDERRTHLHRFFRSFPKFKVTTRNV